MAETYIEHAFEYLPGFYTQAYQMLCFCKWDYGTRNIQITGNKG